MTRRHTASKIVSQLEELTKDYRKVTVESRGGGTYWEVTVYEVVGLKHSHYGGYSLAEAMDRAYKGTFGSP